LPSFRQRDATDCGPACLRYVAAHYRLHIPLTRLRQASGAGHGGASVLGLVEAAQGLGFSAKGVKGPPEALSTIPVPAIAHLLIDKRLFHYVVLTRWTPKRARIMDPATGRIEKWPAARFLGTWTGVLVLLAPGNAFLPGDHTTSPWRRLWALLRPHASTITQTFLGALFSTILALSMSIYVEKIVDSVIPDGNSRLLNLLGTAMLGLLAFRLLLGVFQSLLALRTAQRIDAAIILGYYRRLMRLPQPFFDTMRIGEITSRVADAVKIRNFLNSSLPNLLLNPLILAFSLGAMFAYAWKLALLSLALIPLNCAIYWSANRLNREYQRRIMERAADFDAQLVESLGAQSVIRGFQLEDDAAFRTETRLVRLLRSIWKISIGGLACSTAATLITQSYLIVLLWTGASLVLGAELSPGQLMSSYTLAGYLSGPITSLIGLNSSVQEALIAVDRLFEIMDLEIENDRGTVAFPATQAGEIRFENVSFKHAGRLMTLQEVSFTIPPARITVLSGPSGCGKSTLLALLQRLYLPSQGRILVAGIDLQYFSLGELRRSMAVVPQNPVLMSGTVIENLVPGEPPDMQRLLAICGELGLLEMIEQLPQGFFSQLTESGSNLSGGQRQRLAIARALYRRAPLILLDEPSSALDSAARQILIRALGRLRDEERTIVLAAHDPHLADIADQVVTLASGRVL